MKEVTKWDNNPREMWVWDDDVSKKQVLKVVYIISRDELHLEACFENITEEAFYPVVALDADLGETVELKHCAEIEDEEEA